MCYVDPYLTGLVSGPSVFDHLIRGEDIVSNLLAECGFHDVSFDLVEVRQRLLLRHSHQLLLHPGYEEQKARIVSPHIHTYIHTYIHTQGKPLNRLRLVKHLRPLGGALHYDAAGYVSDMDMVFILTDTHSIQQDKCMYVQYVCMQ